MLLRAGELDQLKRAVQFLSFSVTSSEAKMLDDARQKQSFDGLCSTAQMERCTKEIQSRWENGLYPPSTITYKGQFWESGDDLRKAQLKIVL